MEARVPNEFCQTYTRVTLAATDEIMTKVLVLKNEAKYECLCLEAKNRTAVSQGLCKP